MWPLGKDTSSTETLEHPVASIAHVIRIGPHEAVHSVRSMLPESFFKS